MRMLILDPVKVREVLFSGEEDYSRS